MLTKKHIAFAQRDLNDSYDAGLTVDGIIGAETEAALHRIDVLSYSWSVERRVIGYMQFAATLQGYNAGPIDGLWGPQTDYAIEEWMDHVNGVKSDFTRDDPGDIFPHQSAVPQFYGEPGQNQTKISIPYPMRLAWDTDVVVHRITCHEKVADSLHAVLSQVLDRYGRTAIEELGLDIFGGCLNVRKMRGGTKWSMHSWGIALDFDPVNNRLKWGRDKARFAKAEYGEWWSIWEKHGWTSLGRARDYDWMHVQAASV